MLDRSQASRALPALCNPLPDDAADATRVVSMCIELIDDGWPPRTPGSIAQQLRWFRSWFGTRYRIRSACIHGPAWIQSNLNFAIRGEWGTTSRGGTEMIAITGATGVLGRLVSSKLEARRVGYSPFTGDIRDQAAVASWIAACTPSVVLHFAACVPLPRVDADPAGAFDVNVGGTWNLMKSLAHAQLPAWFFYASTSHVYRSSDRPIPETGAVEPQNAYGETKSIAEQVVSFHGRNAGLETCIGRIFSFYHETQDPMFLYPSLIDRLDRHRGSEPFEIRGGDNVRDLSNADRIADHILALMDRRFTGVINVGSGRGTRIAEFVRKVAKHDLDVKVQQDGPPTTIVADIGLLERVLRGE